MKSLRNLIGIVLALAVSAFAGPGLTKSFYATLVDANGNPADVVPNGNPVTLRLKVYNTSTEPATINSMVLCVAPGVTLLSASPYTLAPYSYDPIKGGINCAGWTVTNFPGIRRQRDLTFTFTAKIDAACTFTGGTWVIGANTGNAYPGGSEFDNVSPTSAYFGCSGPLACPSITSQGYVDQVTENGITIQRGENKNLSQCIATPYEVKDYRTVAYVDGSACTSADKCQAVTFAWNTTSQPTAAYKYVIPWEAEQVGSNGLSARSILVKWGSLATAVPARYCTDYKLPSRIATIDTAVTTTPTANIQEFILVNVTATIPVPPFAISVGPDTNVERMLVTNSELQSGSLYKWTVYRANGGTTATTHAVGAKIALNPLPLDASGNQMQMCMTKHREFVVGGEACDPTNVFNVCSVYGAETEILDYGDGITIYK